MKFELRELSAADIPSAAGIENVCFSSPWSEKTLLSELQNPLNKFFGAFFENTLAGYIGFQTVVDETSVFNVAVLPEFRRNGMGKALVEKLIDEAKKSGSKVVFLEVRAGNLPAINLYEKEGFVFFGLRKNYYENPKENALILRLAFDGSQENEDPIECWDEE